MSFCHLSSNLILIFVFTTCERNHYNDLVTLVTTSGIRKRATVYGCSANNANNNVIATPINAVGGLLLRQSTLNKMVGDLISTNQRADE